MTETTDAQKLINAVEAEKNYRCYAHLRAIVDRKRAGVIIGKKGLCIQYLKTHYNVSVNLSRVALDQDLGRLVHIHGPHKHVTDAWKFRLKREENKDDEATVRITNMLHTI
ncbi:uncharacterized protein B0P05DRAFT_543591 [Gilbertella persicaria]|uniref:uncharacterized protein n=1 Tax=Gilbertella persicaria TaxID=101096 RepID=UPI002221240D|nr:uncharacterized protein B0P05DRAFT_543591 [Gilbertella persicaria]KAI8077977.1 hypothetical protein B0P05DRAFT_543591 [Gilbertella persicaria]